MTEITRYCPNEGNAERIFKRVDNGIPLVGKYECLSCGEVYSEVNLNHDGGDGDLVELIVRKLAKD